MNLSRLAATRLEIDAQMRKRGGRQNGDETGYELQERLHWRASPSGRRSYAPWAEMGQQRSG